MIPKWAVGIRSNVPRRASIILGLLPIAFLVSLWWIVTRGAVEERVIGPVILPSPTEVADSLRDLLKSSDQEDRTLFDHTWLSLRRIALGYALALAVALPLGILMGAFGSARSAFEPLVTASGYVPIATLVPLTMSWFGTDELQKVVFLAMAFGVGWTYLVLAEVVVKNGGLGDLIDTARRRALSGRVYLVIVVITLIAWVADLGWERAGRLLFPYRRSRS